MRNELNQMLVLKYPKIFANYNLGGNPTSVYSGLQVSDGWYNIIDMLCANIQQHINITRTQRASDLAFNRALERSTKQNYKPLINFFANGNTPTSFDIKSAAKIFEEIEPQCRIVSTACPQVVAMQVKEKFGLLRFNYQGGDSYIRGLVSFAESMSSCTCEYCGSPGSIVGTNWLKTLCPEHAQMYE